MNEKEKANDLIKSMSKFQNDNERAMFVALCCRSMFEDLYKKLIEAEIIKGSVPVEQTASYLFWTGIINELEK